MNKIKMNKIKIVLSLTTLLIIGSLGISLADNTIVPDMNFTGDVIKISLSEATDKMLKDGPGAQMAKINLASSEAIASGYSESNHSILEMLNQQNVPLSIQATMPTKADADLVKLQRDFARSQGPFNYEAEMNTLKMDTIKNYFTVLQAEDALKINKENLAVQQRIYDNTVKKFKLGVVSKQDVLQAEVAVLSAKDAVAGADSGLKMAKMGLNSFLGYDVMQQVTLTDTLKAVDLSTVPLADAIEKALVNRNEIKAGAFGLKVQEVLMSRMKVRYPANSSTYMKQEVALLSAQARYSQTISGMEIDVRSKYMAMQTKKSAIGTGTASVAKAVELLRLSELSYSVGMNTVADVQQVQVLVLSQKLALSQALLGYNLAVYDYNTAMTAGTFKAPIV